MSNNPQPKPVPKIDLPKGDKTCELFAINSTCDIISTPATLIEPQIKGHGEFARFPLHWMKLIQ